MRLKTVVNSLLKEAGNRKIRLTHLQVQKLLYFVTGIYMEKTGLPAFEESYYAWKYGPVVPELYQELKHNGSDFISEYFKDATDGKIKIVSRNNEIFWKTINKVLNKYGNTTGAKLSVITHAKGSPWDLANGSERIPNERIAEWVSLEYENGPA